MVLNLSSTSAITYHRQLGEVLLDKVHTARTVVNKMDSIDNTFRNFQMELLAGEDDMVATVRENGVSYQLDFSHVYWNSRLATEHHRIVTTLRRGDVVYDLFAGVGPFSVPAAKRGCVVFANDLNPQSYKWLRTNQELNKITSHMTTHNMDARDFVNEVVKPDLLQRWQTTSRVHLVMNLPALAIDFLDVFVGLYPAYTLPSPGSGMPTVHCYCFTKSQSPEQDVRQRVEARLGHTLPEGATVTNVRNVAPNKDMMCVTFSLTVDILTAHSSAEAELCSEPPLKKARERECHCGTDTD